MSHPLAFGLATGRWADGWVAHRFADGPSARRRARERARDEGRPFGKEVFASAIRATLLAGAIVLVGDPARTMVGDPARTMVGDPARILSLPARFRRWGVIVLFWTPFGCVIDVRGTCLRRRF